MHNPRSEPQTSGPAMLTWLLAFFDLTLVAAGFAYLGLVPSGVVVGVSKVLFFFLLGLCASCVLLVAWRGRTPQLSVGVDDDGAS